MNGEQKTAYEWAKNQNYPSVAARYAKLLAEALDDSQRREREAVRDLKQYQKPMLVIQEKWSPSECPRCHKDFSEYEPCDDGYYARAYSLERCPYCGQLIKWSASEDTSTVYEQPATVQEGTVNLTVMPEEEKDTATPMEEKTTER